MAFGLRCGGSDMNKADVTPIAKRLILREFNRQKTALDVGGFRHCGRRHTLVNALRPISWSRKAMKLNRQWAASDQKNCGMFAGSFRSGDDRLMTGAINLEGLVKRDRGLGEEG
jgi:hypothetical protein